MKNAELPDNIKKIKALLKEYHDINQCKKRLAILDKEVSREQRYLVALYKKVVSELQDVRVLENTSLSFLFSKILGNHKQQIEKERQEYLVAVVKYKECKKVVELLQYEIDLLTPKISDEEFVLKDIERQILSLSNVELYNESIYFEEYKKNIAEERKIVLFQIEIEEVIEVTRKLMSKLEIVLKSLLKAQSRDEWSNQIIRGLDYVFEEEENNMDKAQNYVYVIKKLIFHLRKELKDVGRYQKQFKESENFITAFNTRYYNDLISDWISNRNLTKTLKDTQIMNSIVRELSMSLKNYYQGTISDVNNIREKKNIILEKMNSENL